MVRTRVGYAGGTKDNPTYHNLGDHSETVEIEFDPRQISYKDLLDVFWSAHSPEWPSRARQYMSAIFYHDDGQREAALQTKKRQADRIGRTIHTEISAAGAFYLAEAYHQKYYLQNERGLMREFQAMYPDFWDLVTSTAAARVNGYAGGYGTMETLDKEIDGLRTLIGGAEAPARPGARPQPLAAAIHSAAGLAQAFRVSKTLKAFKWPHRNPFPTGSTPSRCNSAAGTGHGSDSRSLGHFGSLNRSSAPFSSQPYHRRETCL